MSEIDELKAVIALSREVDDLVEQALRGRESLARAMARIMPIVVERVGAVAFVLRTFNEDLQLQTFAFPAQLAAPEVDAFVAEAAGDHELSVVRRGERVLVGRGLDVAGDWFGTAAFLFEAGEGRSDEHLADLLTTVCEEFDNYLHNIRASREKQKTLMELARALRNRVLSDGLADAVRILASAVAVERVLLVVLADESDDATVHVQCYEGTKLSLDTMSNGDAGTDIDEQARGYLRGGDRALLDRLGFSSHAREEVLIFGVQNATVVGKVVVLPKSGDFDTYDRDLISGFTDFICQRVVDFSKEYRTLARSFRPDDVTRMMRTSDYAQRYLTPRERTVAIISADLSGFTRLCEQVLVDPARIGALVDTWGNAAVDLVWKHGGVFDKMVGDCVIALFGPPFFEEAPGELLAAAIRASCDIADMTKALPETPGFEALRETGLGVAVGINLCPLLVGRYGPNENYTGFSSGMNATARLQAQATRHEILVMEEGIAQLPAGHAFSFGEQRAAQVKNVALPLRFRALVR